MHKTARPRKNFIFTNCCVFLFRQFADLSARHGSVLVPPPVELLCRTHLGLCSCVDKLTRQSHTHHEDLLTVWRLARDQSIILQVCHHWHQCIAAAAPPPLHLPLQGRSQQSRTHSERDGGGELQHICWTPVDEGSVGVRTVQKSHWPGWKSDSHYEQVSSMCCEVHPCHSNVHETSHLAALTLGQWSRGFEWVLLLWQEEAWIAS